jgi:hypothetical protein
LRTALGELFVTRDAFVVVELFFVMFPFVYLT